MSENNNAAPVAEAQSTEAVEQVVEQEVASESQDAESAVADAEATLADPNATKAEKKAAEKQIKKFTLKVDGQEEEMEIDLSNEEELKKQLQFAKVAQKRMKESSELRGGLNKLVELLRKDPAKVLAHPDININLKEFASAIINQEAEEAQKTPEQRQIEQLQRELEAAKKVREEEEQQRKEAEFKALQDRQEREITEDIRSGLAAVNMPYSERAVKYMAEYMAIGMDYGIDLSAKDVAPLVKKKMIQDYKELVQSSPDDILDEFVDESIYKRVQKKRLGKAKVAPPTTANQIKSSGNPKSAPAEKPKRLIKDFLND